MNKKIRIGIVGYGNLGRGVESAVTRSSDMELVALLTRRDPASVKTATNIPIAAILNNKSISILISFLLIFNLFLN